jgi:hypothetical protein
VVFRVAIWKLPLPVALVKVSPVVLASVVKMPVPIWKLPLPVALVKVSPVVLASVVKIPVPIWKLPLPVALVKVNFVDERLPKTEKAVEDTVRAPLDATLKTDVVLVGDAPKTVKFKRSAFEDDTTLIPNHVPEAVEKLSVVCPSKKRAVEVVWGNAVVLATIWLKKVVLVANVAVPVTFNLPPNNPFPEKRNAPEPEIDPLFETLKIEVELPTEKSVLLGNVEVPIVSAENSEVPDAAMLPAEKIPPCPTPIPPVTCNCPCARISFLT